MNKLALGTAQFGMDYGIANRKGQVAKTEVTAILELAREIGIDTLDMAKAYGSSEADIGSFLVDHGGKGWKIITKVSDLNSPLSDQLQDSMEKLTVTPCAILAHSVTLYLQDSFQKELINIKENEPATKFGVSLYNETEIRQVLESEFVPEIIQLPLNILDTRLFRRGILNMLKGNSIEIHARSAFLQGLFFLKDTEWNHCFPDVAPTLEHLKSIACKSGLTLAELSLLWLVNLEEVDKVVIGVDNESQLEAHLQTLEKDLTPEVVEEALSLHYENETVLNPSKWM